MKVWRDEVEAKRGPVISAASDHDSTNAHTMRDLFDHDMPDGELKRLLLRLKLFFPRSDKFFVRFGYDDQHNGKNGRAVASRKKGIKINDWKCPRAEFIETVHLVTGTPMATLEHYWPPPNVDDHQNVKSMVEGFRELMKLEGKTGDDAAVDVSEGKRPALARKVRNLQPLAMLARNWVFLFQENEASLEAHVINLAEMARTLFHLMRLPNTSAMPGQTYTAIMHAIHMHVQNIARCQQEGIDEYYPFLATTHMLEQLFGVARALVGAQRNFDTLQFEERFSTIA
jgi:hypothetical protein